MNGDAVIMIRERLRALGDRLEMDRAVSEARVQASIAAYENARADGLCHEGAWECALGVMHGPVAGTRPGQG